MSPAQAAVTREAAPSWPAVSIAEAHARLTAPGARFETETLDIRGVPTRAWVNGPKTLQEVFALGRSFGGREFLIYEGDRATYDGWARATLTLAQAYRAAGVEKGDRVGLVMRNLPEWPVAFFAAALCGAIIVPLNAWWTGLELEYGLADSGCKVAVVDAERYERIAEHLDHLPELKQVWVARSDEEIAHPKVAHLETLLGEVNGWGALPELAAPGVAVGPEDPATIFYTSGTTGKPKGALGTHRNITTNIGSSGVAAARAFLRRGETPPEPSPNAPQRVSLLVVPLFHVTGCNATLGPTIATGGKLVLMRKWDAVEAMKLIERERVGTTGGVPTIAWQLIEHPDRPRYDLSSLETVSYGGAPSAPELVRKIVEVFPKSQPGNGWGMTETSATFTSHVGEDYSHRPDSAGPAAPVGEMRIMTPDGNAELPVGEVGELWCKGPQCVVGYWNKPEATAQTFLDGWVRTGDLARLDEEGFLFIVDRAKDMLIRGGENIYCVEVESRLYEHPAVMDAAIVGIPHRTLGEEPGAVVTLKPGAQTSETELRAWVAEGLAAFKVPVRVLIRAETLPRNANGKILKSELKPLFAEQLT
jgi:long-chain acyl-CoA synthetase